MVLGLRSRQGKHRTPWWSLLVEFLTGVLCCKRPSPFEGYARNLYTRLYLFDHGTWLQLRKIYRLGLRDEDMGYATWQYENDDRLTTGQRAAWARLCATFARDNYDSSGYTYVHLATARKFLER